MQKLTIFLWFNRNAEEAVSFYATVFPSLQITRTTHYPQNLPHLPAGHVMTIEFTLGGIPFVALNTGADEAPTKAVSLSYDCADQAEIDSVWSKLVAAGANEIACGWIQDHYGYTWQINSHKLMKMMTDPDPAKASRAANALYGMKKLDLAAIEKAWSGE